MIVIDVGCATYSGHPEDESIARLVERFGPRTLYGFDPHPSLEEGRWMSGQTTVITRRAAAADHTGRIGFVTTPAVLNELRSYTRTGNDVDCFDLAAFIWGLPDDDLVLKLDCEGAEYPLLEHLIMHDTDLRLELVLVEWHGDFLGRRTLIESRMRCPIEEW